MVRGRLVWAIVVLSWMVAARGARADEIEDEVLAYRDTVVAELEAESPEAAKELAAGDAALESGDDRAALTHYEKAATLAPKSPHPLRRQCNVAASKRDHADAVARCRAARHLRDDGVQRAALARALATPPATDGELREAVALLSTTARESKSLADLGALCEVAIQADNLTELSYCAGELEKRAPNAIGTWVFVALDRASHDRFTEAKAAIVKAKKLGATGLDTLESRIDEKLPITTRFAWVFTFLAAWAGAIVFVTIMGFALSAATRSAAYRLPTTRSDDGHGALLRTIYRGVLWLASVLFYASLPVMLLAVVGSAVGLVYLSLQIGRVPVKLILVAVVVACVTVFVTLKSLFVRFKADDPGPRLPLDEHPKLDAVLSEVADRVGTRKVDTVFFTPNTELAVFERGGILSRIRGAQRERCLLIGAGVLGDMRLIDFKAVLAHEYGHFRNEDTAGGGFALAVRASATKLIIGLIQGGAAGWYNPAWWMARGFYALFTRISHGASRLQEILADRWAAFSYGKEAFASGLRHVIARSVAFDALANKAVERALEEKSPIRNLYRLRATDDTQRKRIAADVTESLERTASPYDTHPSPTERFALVERLEAPTPEAEDTQALAWDLFEGRKELERSSTAALLERVEDRLGVGGLVARKKPARAAEESGDEGSDEPAPEGGATQDDEPGDGKTS